MRDHNKDNGYWDFYIFDTVSFLSEIADELSKADPTYDAQINDRAFIGLYSFALTSATYSAGLPVPDCITRARTLLTDLYPAYVATCALAPKRAHKDEAGGWDMRTRYLALAVLCRLTPEESRPLVQAIDFWPDRDALWEKFIACLGHGTGREPVTTLVWPDAYSLALEMFDEDGTDLTRQAALMRFDKGWLKEMRSGGNPFYSNMNNKNNTYVGYWNFEAAALAVMHDVDDTLLGKSKTYPKDWADWTRQQGGR